MSDFEWLPEYSVGNETLDAQHQGIFRLCQRVHDLPVASSHEAQERYHELLDEAARYARSHFHTEEHLLRKAGYGALADHQSEHRHFQDQLTDLLMAATEGRIDHRAFANFLAAWLREHILRSDMQYKLLFSR